MPGRPLITQLYLHGPGLRGRSPTGTGKDPLIHTRAGAAGDDRRRSRLPAGGRHLTWFFESLSCARRSFNGGGRLGCWRSTPRIGDHRRLATGQAGDLLGVGKPAASACGALSTRRREGDGRRIAVGCVSVGGLTPRPARASWPAHSQNVAGRARWSVIASTTGYEAVRLGGRSPLRRSTATRSHGGRPSGDARRERATKPASSAASGALLRALELPAGPWRSSGRAHARGRLGGRHGLDSTPSGRRRERRPPRCPAGCAAFPDENACLRGRLDQPMGSRR